VEQFEGLQYALFSTSFVEVLGGIFFIFTACFIIKDKYNATRGLQGKLNGLDSDLNAPFSTIY